MAIKTDVLVLSRNINYAWDTLEIHFRIRRIDSVDGEVIREELVTERQLLSNLPAGFVADLMEVDPAIKQWLFNRTRTAKDPNPTIDYARVVQS